MSGALSRGPNYPKERAGSRVSWRMGPGELLRCGLLGALLVGCSWAAKDRRHGPPGRSFRQDCALPAVADASLVLEARRTISGDGEPKTERGQLTSSDTCQAGVPDCVVVPRSVLLALYEEVRSSTAPGFLSENERVSPHFGFRTLSVRWNGGSCSFVDGVTDPLVAADRARFQRAYDAVVAAIVRNRMLPPAAIADCRQRLEVAVASYNAAHGSDALILKTAEATSPGHHGEVPYAAFAVEGAASSLTLLWQKGRDLGSSDWSEWPGNESPRVVTRKHGGSVATLSGSGGGASAFFVTFKPVVDACLRVFDGR